MKRLFLAAVILFSGYSLYAAESLDLQLIRACEKGDLLKAQTLVQQGASPRVRYTSDTGWSAVMFAVQSKNLELVRFLVERGGEPNYTVPATGFTALMKASVDNNLPIVKYLILKKANINAKTKTGVTPLIFAVDYQGKNPDVAKFLVESGADMDAMFQNKYSALFLSVDRKQFDFAAYLIEKGASIKTINAENLIFKFIDLNKKNAVSKMIEGGINPDTVDESKNTILMHAAKKKWADIVRLLISKKADVNNKNKDSVTALMNAVDAGDFETIQILVDAKANLNTENKYSGTALSKSAESGKQQIFDYLLLKGADTDISSSDRLRLVHFAAKSGNPAILNTVLAIKKTNVNAKSKTGITPLMYAALTGKIITVNMLLDKGADPKALTDSKWSVIMYAAQSGSMDVVQKLEKLGCDIHGVNEDGTTVLMQAAASGNLGLITYLVSKGVDVNKRNRKNESVVQFAALMTDPGAVFTISGPAASMFHKWDTVSSSLVPVKINIAAVKYFMDTPAVKFSSNIDEINSLLYYSVLAADGNAAAYFLFKKADPNISIGNKILLHEAVRQNCLSCAMRLIEAGAKINTADGDGYTAVIHASLAGRVDILGYLLAKRPDLKMKVQSLKGQDALMFAAFNGHSGAVNMLIKAGADVNAVKSDGWSVLLIAINGGNAEIVRQLVAAGAKTDLCLPSNKMTPLMLAVQFNNIDMVKYFVNECRVDIKAVDRNNMNALQYAEYYYKQNNNYGEVRNFLASKK